MALFPHLEFDNKVQIGDKIRLSGIKSFVSVGTTALTTVTIKPENDITAISVYNSDASLRYLDWAYLSFKMDIDSSNQTLSFKEGSTAYNATLSTGTYTLAGLVTEVALQLTASGAFTYTGSVSSDDKITISATSSFSIVPASSNIWEQLGFRLSTLQSLSNASTYTGRRVRYLSRKVTLTIGNGSSTQASDGFVNLYSLNGDALFSSDSDLIEHEPDLLKWLPDGKNSYKFIHRRAQELILAFLDEQGYTDIYRNKFLLDAIIDLDEVKEWSTFLALRLIFKGNQNAVDDVFGQKSAMYLDEEKRARNRAILRLDLNNDGVLEDNSNESFTVSSISVARR